MTPPTVVVLGDVVTDVVARLRHPIAPGSDTAARVLRRPGGSAANVSAWLAALAVPTVLIGRVGADAEGAEHTENLRRAGVDTRLVADPDRPTGTVVALVAPGGERSMITDRGANLALSPADLPVGVFLPGRHLHLSGYALLDPGPRAAARRALRLAGAAGMTVSVDPSSAAPLARVGPQRFLGWTRGPGLCLANLAEARVLTGRTQPLAAARALTAAYGEVVVTLGARGALWAAAGEVVRVPAVPVRAVDTTGAGDAFSAGFLAARGAGADPEQALRSGAALAARAVTVVGGRPPEHPRPDGSDGEGAAGQ